MSNRALLSEDEGDRIARAHDIGPATLYRAAADIIGERETATRKQVLEEVAYDLRAALDGADFESDYAEGLGEALSIVNGHLNPTPEANRSRKPKKENTTTNE